MPSSAWMQRAQDAACATPIRVGAWDSSSSRTWLGGTSPVHFLDRTAPQPLCPGGVTRGQHLHCHKRVLDAVPTLPGLENMASLLQVWAMREELGLSLGPTLFLAAPGSVVVRPLWGQFCSDVSVRAGGASCSLPIPQMPGQAISQPLGAFSPVQGGRSADLFST